MKIFCFGAGCVGLVSMTILAIKNEKHEFILFDNNQTLISNLQKGNLHFYEPNLE